MPHSREVWRIDKAGSLERITRRTEELPDPVPGEARVAVRAVGLNFADIFAGLGLYSATPAGSFIPGLEFAGVVEKVGPPAGPQAAGERSGPVIRPGDRVAGVTRFGAYATALNVDVRCLRPIRPAWSFAEAAAYPVQGLTAWYGLVRLGGLSTGDVVLIQSAAGGVGLNALAILAARGARAIAAVGDEAKRQWLVTHRGLAPEQIVVRERRAFGAQLDRALAAIGAAGFDVAFDAVAGPFFQPAYDRLRPGGRMIVYGAADFMSRGRRPNYARLVVKYLRRPRVDPLEMISANRSVMGFNLIWMWDRVDTLPSAFDELDALITAPPIVGCCYPFAEVHAALQHLQSGASIGKIVLGEESSPESRPGDPSGETA